MPRLQQPWDRREGYEGNAKGLIAALIQKDFLSAADYEDLKMSNMQESGMFMSWQRNTIKKVTHFSLQPYSPNWTKIP